MKNPIVGHGIPSALFVFVTRNGEYELVRGANVPGKIVQDVTDVICKTMITTPWVYVDYLMRSGYVNPGVQRLQNLFEAPITESPIAGFDAALRSSPGSFFGEKNAPGLVISPFAAINLGRAIEVVIVVRDRAKAIFPDDVIRSLERFTSAENGTPILLPELATAMSERIGTSTDLGEISVDGETMYLSVNQEALLGQEPAVKPASPKGSIVRQKRKVKKVEGPQTPSLWFPGT